MRVLAVTNTYPPNARGGYGEICADVTSALAARGHDVVVLTCRTGKEGYAMGGVDVRPVLSYVPGAWRRPLKGLQALVEDQRRVREVIASGFDAVLVWHMRGVIKASLRVLHDAGLPVFYLLHDRWVLYERPGAFLVPWAHIDRLGVASLREFAGSLSPASLELRAPPISTRGIVCFASEWLRDDLARLGWRAKRSHILPDGVGGEWLDQDRPVTDASPRALYAGRVHPQKGLHVAIQALSFAPGFELSVAGYEQDGAYGSRLQAVARARVAWLGELPRADLRRELGRHDVLVYPSVEPESGWLGVLEGMAAGAVVVSSAPGAPRELLKHERNALLFEPGDAAALGAHLRRLAADPALVERLRAAARQTAARYPLEEMVARLEALVASWNSR